MGSTGRMIKDLYNLAKNEGYSCRIAYGRGGHDGIPEEDAYCIGSKLSLYRTAFLSRINDREGFMLLDIIDGRTYSDSLSVRQSTLHWVGDRKGNISAPAISHYAKEMSGFDTLNGVYAYGGVGGDATLTLSSRVQTAALEALNKKN